MVHNYLMDDGKIGVGHRLHSKTLKPFYKDCGIKDRTCQEKNKARRVAEGDIRNMITCYVGTKLFSENVPPALIINYDATQFKVPAVRKEKVMVMENRNKKKAVESSEACDGLNTFVKYMSIISASGDIAEPIFIIAHDKLPANAMHWLKVPGLGGQRQGHVVIMKKRGGNKEYFDTLLREQVIGFVKQQREIYDYKDKNAFIVADGEREQIEPLLRETSPGLIDGLQEVLELLNINMMKLPASCSGVLQPCDVAKWFNNIQNKILRLEKISERSEILPKR